MSKVHACTDISCSQLPDPPISQVLRCVSTTRGDDACAVLGVSRHRQWHCHMPQSSTKELGVQCWCSASDCVRFAASNELLCCCAAGVHAYYVYTSCCYELQLPFSNLRTSNSVELYLTAAQPVGVRTQWSRAFRYTV
jgi:hypothetical protein